MESMIHCHLPAPGEALTSELEAFQAEVLISGDAYDCYHFAMDTPGAKVKMLQEMVVALGRSWACAYFALDVPGADISALQETILEICDEAACLFFALKVEGADVLRLVRVVARARDAQGNPDVEGDLKALAKRHPAIITPEILADLSLEITL